MAFDSDDEDERPAGSPASKSDPSELGALAAGLPASERRASSPPGSDADDTMDATALAALSQGQSARPGRPVADDVESSRVRLGGAGSTLGAAAARSSASTPPARGASFGWLIGLAIGFAVGVPVGGVLFPHTTVVSVPASAPKTSLADREAQLAAAEVRARAADQAAAAVRPLPVQRMAQAAQLDEPAQPATAEAIPSTDQPPTAAEPAQPLPGNSPPIAASASAAGKKLAALDARGREAARAATAALNARPPADGVAAQGAPPPQPSAAQAPAAATAAPQPAAPVGPDGRSVDELLDQALASSTARKEQERAERALAPPDALPLNPSREDVTRAMTVILPAIRGCAAGRSGLATVGLVVKNDGHVESATVSGAPFEGDRTGRCMEGVVRRAKFPRFVQSSFRIQFPFAIQ